VSLEPSPKGELAVAIAKRKLAEDWLYKASNNLDAAKGYLKGYMQSSEAIERAQECIELSAKSIFALLDIEYPRQHSVAPDKKEFSALAEQIQQKRLLEKLEEQNLGYAVKLPRILLLTYFWSQFYTIAKYGFEPGNLASAKDLFAKKEAELAVAHAEECYQAASQLRYLGEEALAKLRQGFSEQV